MGAGNLPMNLVYKTDMAGNSQLTVRPSRGMVSVSGLVPFCHAANRMSNTGYVYIKGERMKRIVLSFAFVCLALVSAQAKTGASIAMKLSGPGAVNDSTIKAGQPVSVDIYMTNDTTREGFSFGFAFKSETIKKIIHPNADSGKPTSLATSKLGDVKGFNGWQDKSVWDFGGVYVVEKDWDGVLPELLGFGGISVKQHFMPTATPTKVLSIDVIVPDTGRLVIDSAFFPPGGEWVVTPPPTKPAWGGPYKFKVVK